MAGMKTRLLLVACAATVSLAACGGGEEPASSGASGNPKESENRKAMLDFARCMRENGIDMPDPTFDENGGAQMRIGKGLNPESAKFQKAQEACRDEQPMGPGRTTAGGGGE
jgi:hypothetical protein